MSNFDLLEWCKYLKIPTNNVLSRDLKVPPNHKQSLFVYYLQPFLYEWKSLGFHLHQR